MTNGLLTRLRFLARRTWPWPQVARTAAVLARTTGAERALEKIEPTDGLIGALERQRRRAGASVNSIHVVPTVGPVRFGTGSVETCSCDSLVPGKEVRLRAGDVLRAIVRNELPQPTTIHWHGIALRNDMDGVPDLTQQAIAPGTPFTTSSPRPTRARTSSNPTSGPSSIAGCMRRSSGRPGGVGRVRPGRGRAR